MEKIHSMIKIMHIDYRLPSPSRITSVVGLGHAKRKNYNYRLFLNGNVFDRLGEPKEKKVDNIERSLRAKKNMNFFFVRIYVLNHLWYICFLYSLKNKKKFASGRLTQKSLDM
jgi:hypothetical protein